MGCGVLVRDDIREYEYGELTLSEPGSSHGDDKFLERLVVVL